MIEIVRNGAGLGLIVGCGLPLTRSLLEQIVAGVLRLQHIQFQLLHPAAPFRQPRRNQHPPARQLRQQLLHRHRSRFRVDVVENQTPAGMLLQPVDRCGDLCFLIGDKLSFRNVQDQRTDQTGQLPLEVLRGIGGDEQ